jgi:hypothetical protein
MKFINKNKDEKQNKVSNKFLHFWEKWFFTSNEKVDWLHKKILGNCLHLNQAAVADTWLRKNFNKKQPTSAGQQVDNEIEQALSE